MATQCVARTVGASPACLAKPKREEEAERGANLGALCGSGWAACGVPCRAAQRWRLAARRAAVSGVHSCGRRERRLRPA